MDYKNYRTKYFKYKQKYNDLKSNNSKLNNSKLNNNFMYGGNKSQKIILLDGTSSAGKSTFCKYFKTKDYECFSIDNYWSDKRVEDDIKNVSNEYNAEQNIYNYNKIGYMMDDAFKTKKNLVLDHINQREIINYMKSKNLENDLFIIVVYTNLENLAKNIVSRRKEGDYRAPQFVYGLFSGRYIKTDKDDKDKIDKINRKAFRQILFDNFKYVFENKHKLIDFSNRIFERMNIRDDEYHYIKLKNGFRCDYLLITTDKTMEEMYQEISKLKIYN